MRNISSKTLGSKRFLTIQAAGEQWLKNTVSLYKPSSRASTKSNLKKILEEFGHLKCSAIKSPHIQDWVAKLKGEGLATRTIENYLKTFKMFWWSLEGWEYVDHNPFRRVRRPRSDGRRPPSFTAEQLRAILAEAREEPYRTMFHVLAETGMRGGELCGLYIEDLDLENRLLHIRRSSYQGHIQNTGKTASALRTICISPFLTERLRKYTESVQRRRGRTAELLFTPETGTLAFDNSDVVKVGLKPILRALEIKGPRIGLHAFRHANKSLMVHLGVPEKYRCERMGHNLGSGKMDLIYTHTETERHKEYAEIIGQALFVG
jgi:integrase